MEAMQTIDFNNSKYQSGYRNIAKKFLKNLMI
jgi:hypothetical protein